MKPTVTFGEIMLRLEPEGYNRFVQADKFGAVYGGGEANVAVSLANYGLPAEFVTKLPAHEIGQCAVNALRRYGVGTEKIIRGGERIGIYFIEKGASQRASKVIYDRAYSAVSLAKAEEFDWEAILAGAGWFHFSGITPAVSGELAKACLEGVKTARKLGVTVSCDLNYRGKMWSLDKAKEVMGGLMPYTDVLIANEEHIKSILGIDVSVYAVEDSNLCREGCAAMARTLHEKYGFQAAAITQRRSLSASDNKFKAAFWQNGETAFSPQHTMHIVDRVGSGDAFTAGILYGMQTGLSAQETVDFAAAACCLKHSVEGDFNLMSADEVFALAGGEGSGSVQR